jgi:UDP-xylose/UDP-N-acetylglucosamine transporter B4
MAAGYLYGKRYSRAQTVAVIVLSTGVVLAAWSDSVNKVVLPCHIVFYCFFFLHWRNPILTAFGTQAPSGDSSTKVAFSTGLVILFIAQVLSAAMGLYTETTYKIYGPQWRENLFYSHVLSLPLFLPFAPAMVGTAKTLAQSPSLALFHEFGARTHVPSQFAYLAANVLTQYACIRGVNLLAAASSALTVTIVLNIRKLVSLLLSIWLFGNSLALGTIFGAILVFGGGALYTLDSRSRSDKPASNGDASKKND